MPLDSQLVDVKFVQGMDTHTNKKLVVPGKWNLLRNATLAVDGSLTKRPGVTGLVPGTTGDGNGLATFNDELLTVDADVVSSVSSPTSFPSSRVPTAHPMSGQLGFVDVVGKSQVQRTTGMQDSTDCAYGLGLTVYVWTDATATGTVTGVSMSVVDEATGAKLIAPWQMRTSAGVFCPRVVFSVDCFFVLYIDAGVLYCRAFTVSATGVVSIGAETDLGVGASLAGLNFDCCEFLPGASGSIAVSYPWSDGVTSVRSSLVTQVAGVPALGTTVNLISEAQVAIATLTGIGVCWMSSTTAGYFATFATSTAGAHSIPGTACRLLNSAFAAFAATIQADATVGATWRPCHVAAYGNIASAVAVCFTDQQSEYNTAAFVPLRRTEIATTGAVTTVVLSTTLISSACFATSATTAAGPQGPFIYGKPFSRGDWDSSGAGKLENGTLFLPVAILENYQGIAANAVSLNQQNTIFVLDGSTGEVVSKALYGALGVAAINNVRPRVSSPCSTPAVPSGFALEATERTTLSFADGLPLSATGVCRLTFAPRTTTPPIHAQLGTATYFAGGSMSQYDSAGITEVGFPLFPEGVSCVTVAGGGAMTAGVHQVVAVYEWIDGMGQRHQSAPSLPVSVTTAALNDSMTVLIPTMLLSQKANITIVLYMTQAAGLVFNRVTSIAAPIANSTAAAFVTATITASDASIATNELLYTQPLQAGTTLPNVAPGPCTALGIHQNRLFVNLSDKPGAFRYSQQLVENVGLQWSETLGGTTPVDGGDLLGFCAMDEKVILFCERKLYVIVGTGPTSSGGFNNYSEPVEILSDVGCSEARSILKMPRGIMFKSPKGWYRLGRDLQVQYVGEGVQEFDGNDVSSAVYLEDEQECRFSSLSGTQLIYAYETEQWSTAQVVATDAIGPNLYSMADAVWWPALGLYVSISATLGLNRDTPGAYIDDPGSSIATPLSITGRTSFLHLGALEGFQRVRWLYLTATSTAAPVGTLTITVDYDDVYGAVTGFPEPGAYSATKTLTALFAVGTTVPDFRHKLHRQKCKSVAFTFTEEGTALAASGITGFEALALEMGMKKGTNRLPGAQSIA